MLSKPRLKVGETVVTSKNIIYLPPPPKTGLVFIKEGTHGRVLDDSRRGYRTVLFDKNEEVVVSVRDISPPALLDRITSAIFS